jgi:hypothetical protein
MRTRMATNNKTATIASTRIATHIGDAARLWTGRAGHSGCAYRAGGNNLNVLYRRMILRPIGNGRLNDNRRMTGAEHVSPTF